MINRMNETAEKAFTLMDELLELKGFTHVCPRCNGDKVIRPSLAQPTIEMYCPMCKGMGVVREEK